LERKKFLKYLNEFLILSKAKISAQVVFTSAASYFLASKGHFDWQKFTWMCIGTTLCAFSACAFNQRIEIGKDAKMTRTCVRPLVVGHLTKNEAVIWAFGTGILGVITLYYKVNATTAYLGLGNILLYVVAYTPMKAWTAWNTFIGAIVGAVPVLMGWTAEKGIIIDSNYLDYGGLVLSYFLMLWQIPHFMALSFKYRDDYKAGGFVMLATDRPTHVGVVSIISTLLLLPTGFALYYANLTTKYFIVESFILNGIYLIYSIKFHNNRNANNARSLFLYSLLYLPTYLTLMTLHKTDDPTYFSIIKTYL